MGIINGMIGGATGLAGIARLSGRACEAGRAMSREPSFSRPPLQAFVMIIVAFGGIGLITLRHRPPVLARAAGAGSSGTWLGWMLYGKLDEGAFRRVVLVLLLISGVTLSHRHGDEYRTNTWRAVGRGRFQTCPLAANTIV